MSDKDLQLSNVGRKTIVTEEVVRKLESILQLGVNDTTACQYAKISRDTFYDHLKNDPHFSDRIQSAKDLVTIAAGQVVTNDIIVNKDVTSAKWWLERKAPDEFGDKRVTAVQVNIQNVIEEKRKKYGF